MHREIEWQDHRYAHGNLQPLEEMQSKVIESLDQGLGTVVLKDLESK
jgi:hypothetical protein